MPSNDNLYLQYPARATEAGSVPTFVDLEMPGSRPVFQNFTILGGQGVLSRGSVLGQITTGGKLKLAAAAAGDGSQDCMAVLNTDLDTTGGDVTFDVMVNGAILNPDALVLGAGTTSAVAQAALLARGFAFRKPGFSG